MYFFYGVLCLSLAVLLFAITLLGSRNPIRPAWAGESIVANILTPAMLGLFVMGIAYVTKVFLVDSQPGLMELVYAALAVAGTVAIIMMLGIRRKLAAFAAGEKGGEVIEVDFQANRQPDLPINDKPGFRKAA